MKEKILNNKKMNEILSIIEREFRNNYESKIRKIILYGSYARGDYDSESDIDILIITQNGDLKELHNTRTEAAHQILLDFEILVSIIFVEESHYRDWLETIPFYQSVGNEGIPIYG
ncbi:MAG: nucleotidyltransferase domain-containing protein [Bacteroidetes bacterium]|nr:nucleotidyltransferase domain-containing protein [Bacteroidota bacterium]MBU2585086.1 nucleotidyltransferase domain-containing protein [Bacteroidota bacterium]